MINIFCFSVQRAFSPHASQLFPDHNPGKLEIYFSKLLNKAKVTHPSLHRGGREVTEWLVYWARTLKIESSQKMNYTATVGIHFSVLLPSVLVNLHVH